MVVLLSAFALALILSWLSTPWAISLARRLNVVDNRDRSHDGVSTPRFGGIPIVLSALGIAWSLFIFVNHVSADLPRVAVPLVGLCFGVCAVFLMGVVDDIVDLNGKLKLGFLLAVSTAVGLSGVRIPHVDLPWIGEVHSLWLTTPLSVLWIVAAAIAIDFSDGVDGLAAGTVALTSLVIAIAATALGVPFVAVLAIAIAGASIGFLRYNWPQARIMLGESGSLALGFAVAALTILAVNQTGRSSLYLAVAVAMIVPLLDVALTLFRRVIIHRRSVFSSERGHVHHRLIEAGLNEPQTLRVLLFTTFITSVSGLAFALVPTRWTAAIALLSLIPVVTIFRAAGSVRLREMIAAARSAIRRSRDNERYNKSFEEMQIRFRSARTFDSWWDELCEAGRRLQITSIDMICTNRDGTKRELNWSSPQCESQTHAVHLSLPVPQRRIDSPIECRLAVSRNGSLESVGYRMSLFGRLLESHGLSKLPKDSPVRLKRQLSVLRLAGLNERVTNLQQRRRALPISAEVDVLPVEIDQPAPVPAELTTPHRPSRKPRVAIVHDFLYIYGGAERVLESILAIYPDADLFSLFDFLDSQQRKFIGERKVITSFIQRLPFARRYHRHYLALMPLAIEQLDMSGYDVVISSSYLAAKGVVTGPDQVHVCYCHTPARFAWDLQEQCLDEAGMKRGIKSVVARLVLHYIRAWDLRSSHGVDAYVTNSNFVRSRVKKIYGRDATTIYPPVDVINFSLCSEKENFYVTASRLVPYKKIALIAEAFTKMPDKRLVIIGDGPEFAAIRARSGPNVIMKGFLPKDEMVGYMQRAKAFVFTAIEDFGIVPVEAQSCGTPVIALNRGGLCESVIDGKTGILFEEQTSQSIIDAVRRFEAHGHWDSHQIRHHAMKFSAGRFQSEFGQFVDDEVQKRFAGRGFVEDTDEGASFDLKLAPASGAEVR